MPRLLLPLVLMALPLTAGSVAAQLPSFRVGEPLPHIHLPEIRTGEPIDLAQYRGRKVLIAEFASW